MQGGACRGSTLDDVDMQVEVVGGQDQWIERGWGFWPPKDGYRARVPGIVCLSKNPGATCKGSAGDGVDTEFEGTVGGERKNEQGRAFGVQNRKPCRLGSVSVWGVQIAGVWGGGPLGGVDMVAIGPMRFVGFGANLSKKKIDQLIQM
jgi:hypothetical protein